MTILPEELSAFVDGQLDPARHAEIAAEVAADPQLSARVAALRALNERLSSHFAPILTAPLPERLTAPLAPKTANVVEFRPAREKRSARSFPRWGWIAGPALAASLALAVFLPGDAGTSGSSLSPTVVAALDRQLVAMQPADAPVRILLSFRDEEGQYCRVFAAAEQGGIACRGQQGWEVESAGTAGSQHRTEYRMAGVSVPELFAEAQRMAAGPALTAEEERAARSRGWKRWPGRNISEPGYQPQ